MGRFSRRRRESGFAMLLVFLMAAVFAMMLYLEMPRLAIEAQRNREQLLIARGEQYKRGIQMFVKKNQRWPTKIEELENTNNQRFLRKRYIDPMTGKDEWRLIHIQNGMLTDSLVNKPPTAQDQSSNSSGFQWGVSTAGGDLNSGQGQGQMASAAAAGAALANRRRASDTLAPGVTIADPQQPTDPNNPNPQNPGAVGVPGMPGMVNGQQVPLPPGMTLPAIPGQSPIPGQYAGMPGQYPAQPGQPTLPGQPGQYPMPMQPQPGPGQLPGQPVNTQTGGVSPTQTGYGYGSSSYASSSPYPTAPGANGTPPNYAQPGNTINGQPQQGANLAQQMIQQILTSPRPGGAPLAANGQTIGGGIAGVASNADAEGIMVYKDHKNYKEWEFIFDPTKVLNPPNPLTGGLGTPASQLGSIGGSPAGTPVGGAPGLGTPGFGSGFGAPGVGTPGLGTSTASTSGSSGFSYGSSSYGGISYGMAPPGAPTAGTPTTTAPPPTGPTRFVTDVGTVPVNPTTPTGGK